MIGKICNALTALMLAAALVLVALLVGPRLLGMEPVRVQTGSMYPNLPVGSLITVDRGVTPADIDPGDIITFTAGEELVVTHRVMEKLEAEERFITKGDNNESVDEPVRYERLYGKVVFCVPMAGDLALSFESRAIIPYVMGFLIVFILLIFLPEIFKKETLET